MNKIRRGDEVIVLAGKDKGKQGEVLRTIPDQHKIVVKGVNILKRHTKAGQQRGVACLRPGQPRLGVGQIHLQVFTGSLGRHAIGLGRRQRRVQY